MHDSKYGRISYFVLAILCAPKREDARLYRGNCGNGNTMAAFVLRVLLTTSVWEGSDIVLSFLCAPGREESRVCWEVLVL